MATNLDAENGLLGCILKQGDLIKDITLKEHHFSSSYNRILFKTLTEIEKRNEPIDLVTVVTTMGPGNLSEIGGKQYLAMLINSVPSLEPFKTYEKYIIDSWKLRTAREIQSKEIHDLTDINERMTQLSELELEDNAADYDHKESLLKLYQNIDAQEKGLSGLDTGFKDLNKYLDGYQKGDLIISAARPSVGKTAKMLNHAIKHCENGGITAIYSLEMGEESLNKRLLSTIGRIDGHKLKNPKQYFNGDDWERFNKAIGILGDMNIHIFDKSGQTIAEIRSSVRKLRKRYPNVPMMVQIDYLQLIRSDHNRFQSKNEEVGEMTRSLKELARDEQVPVYLLSQLSRGVESRQDKRPMMSDIRDSGSVEQDADVIEFLYRDDYYTDESEHNNIIEVIIAKQRNGAVGTVKLAYLKEYNLFVDLDDRNES